MRDYAPLPFVTFSDGLKLREYEEAKYSIDTRDYASF